VRKAHGQVVGRVDLYRWLEALSCGGLGVMELTRKVREAQARRFTCSAERFDESAHGDPLKRVESLLLGFKEGHQTCRDLLPG
jgi:hypothetical protein